MFALLEDGICIAINTVGFSNVVLTGSNEIIESNSPVIGFRWDGLRFTETEQGMAQAEQDLMRENLRWCDLQNNYHNSSDPRAVATQEEIYIYARDCRNRVIEGVINEGVNPVRPTEITDI